MTVTAHRYDPATGSDQEVPADIYLLDIMDWIDMDGADRAMAAFGAGDATARQDLLRDLTPHRYERGRAPQTVKLAPKRHVFVAVFEDRIGHTEIDVVNEQGRTVSVELR